MLITILKCKKFRSLFQKQDFQISVTVKETCYMQLTDFK